GGGLGRGGGGAPRGAPAGAAHTGRGPPGGGRPPPLLICGKGHETGQIVGRDVLPFDDAEQASIAVAALEGRG
ncbi:MAG: hypothetical protein JJT81_19990, partial [Rubellimicrobium sp.]|nr:hypothetical protein [Rubellimicrobium sp.]